MSERVPWIGDGAVNGVSEDAGKVFRAQSGKFAGEATRGPELLCHRLLYPRIPPCRHDDCTLHLARTLCAVSWVF